MLKSFKWVISFIGISFFVTVATMKNFTAYLNTLHALLVALVVGAVIYMLLQKTLGLDVTRDRWKLNATIAQSSMLRDLLAYFYQLSQGVYIGFKDWTEFREGLEDASFTSKHSELLALLAAVIVCFSFGVLNLLFPMALGYMLLKQFEIDHAAAVHVASGEILFGLFLLLMTLGLHLSAWTFILYPVVSLIWIANYLRDTQRSYIVILLQFVKIGIYLGSKFLPFYLLNNFTIPI